MDDIYGSPLWSDRVYAFRRIVERIAVAVASYVYINRAHFRHSHYRDTLNISSSLARFFVLTYLSSASLPRTADAVIHVLNPDISLPLCNLRPLSNFPKLEMPLISKFTHLHLHSQRTVSLHSFLSLNLASHVWLPLVIYLRSAGFSHGTCHVSSSTV